MKVKYRHISDQNTEKMYDTKKAYRKCPSILSLSISDGKTLDDWNRQELERFRKDKERGVVLDYRVEEV